MAKNKISEFSSTPANNTDIGGINIAEGCAPSGINNAIRELMAQLKDQQAGTDSDSFTVGGGFTCTGAAVFFSTVALGTSATASTQSVTDDTTKVATTAFVRDIVPTGVIVMWSGSIASIPSGWLLCDGSNSTPDLRNRFIVGAGSTYSVAGTGGATSVTSGSGGSGSTDNSSVVVDRDGWGTTGGGLGSATSGRLIVGSGQSEAVETLESLRAAGSSLTTGSHSHTMSSHTHSVATLPPYYALAYIMKS